MKSLTIKEVEKNFDTIISRVESGEKFIIQGKKGSVILSPYNSTLEEQDDLIRIYTDHEEGS
jgi:hypothetical protein